MTPGLNKVMLIGRIGRAPETRFTPAGKAVGTFSIGVARSWQDAEGRPQGSVDWFNVVAWGDLAEHCAEMLAEGDRAYVEGRIQIRSWDDGDGRRHQQAEIVAAQVLALENPPVESTPASHD